MTVERPLGCLACACQNQCLLGRQREAVRLRWSPHVAERSFHKGDRLQQQGQSAATFQVIKVGTVLALRSGDDGVERPVGMFGGGQLLGGMALLQRPEALSCQALSAGRVCEVAVAAVGTQALADAEFLFALAWECADINAQLADWARVVRIRSTAGQLAGALLQLASLQRSTLVRLPSHTVLATLLATTRETIARTLRQLGEQQCVVRHDRWHCEIHRARLLALAAGNPPLQKT